MTELAEEELSFPESSARFEMSREANNLRKSREFGKALPLYRELAKDASDPYAIAGLLHCLRMQRMFEEALPLCSPPNSEHLELDWYRNEVVWTLIQGRLQQLEENASADEVVSEAESILSLEPKGSVAKWSIVYRVLKAAKTRNRWEIVSDWLKKVSPNELSVAPMKDDRGREGWCQQAMWHNLKIRSEIEVGDKQQAILGAHRAIGLFPHQARFFERLEALANFRMGRLNEAEVLYGKLSNGGRPEWWILSEYAKVLSRLGKDQEALVLMCKAALSNKRLESLVTLFSDIGNLCHKTGLKKEARNHLLLCKQIREEQEWSIPQAVSSSLATLESELEGIASPASRGTILVECQGFWRTTVGAHQGSREPSVRDREGKRLLRGKLKLGSSERPYCFLLSDVVSYFCLKSDLPEGAADGMMLQFDAIPSFDKKKNQKSWKAVNLRIG
jgi:hypothetical protein